MMIGMEPAERLARIARARARYDRARDELMREISDGFADAEALPEGRKRELGPSAIGRAAKFTREYVSQLRDARSQGTPLA